MRQVIGIPFAAAGGGRRALTADRGAAAGTLFTPEPPTTIDTASLIQAGPAVSTDGIGGVRAAGRPTRAGHRRRAAGRPAPPAGRRRPGCGRAGRRRGRRGGPRRPRAAVIGAGGRPGRVRVGQLQEGAGVGEPEPVDERPVAVEVGGDQRVPLGAATSGSARRRRRSRPSRPPPGRRSAAPPGRAGRRWRRAGFGIAGEEQRLAPVHRDVLRRDRPEARRGRPRCRSPPAGRRRCRSAPGRGRARPAPGRGRRPPRARATRPAWSKW